MKKIKSIMRRGHPVYLLNSYLPMRRRIEYTIWPPRLREWIGGTVLSIAIKIMMKQYFKRYGAKISRAEIGISARLACRLVDGTIGGYIARLIPHAKIDTDTDAGAMPMPIYSLIAPLKWYDRTSWYAIVFATIVLMIRNNGYTAIVRQACEAYNDREKKHDRKR